MPPFRERTCSCSGSCLMQSRVSQLPVGARTPLIPLSRNKVLVASGAVSRWCLQLQLPHKAKFGRGSVTSNFQACSTAVEILCLMLLSPLLQAYMCGDACLVEFFYLKNIWTSFAKLSNWFAVVICKLGRKY